MTAPLLDAPPAQRIRRPNRTYSPAARAEMSVRKTGHPQTNFGRLSDEAVRAIRKRFAAGERRLTIAVAYGISPQHVWNIHMRLNYARVAG